MNVHKNARLTPRGRERIVRLVESGQTPRAVAGAAGVCPRTVRKWIDRYHREGMAGLKDRSSRPHRLQPADPATAYSTALRRFAANGSLARRSPPSLHLSPATVSRILRRFGLNKIGALEPCEPVRRYEREHPGETHPPRYQEARQDRLALGTASPAIAEDKAIVEHGAKGSAGSSSMSAIDDNSRIAFAKCHAQREESAVPTPSSRLLWPTTTASASRSSG